MTKIKGAPAFAKAMAGGRKEESPFLLDLLANGNIRPGLFRFFGQGNCLPVKKF